MNKRQHKKLCKKAAEAMAHKSCINDDGVWYVSFGCGDSEDAWPYLANLFSADVNTRTCEDDEVEDSECGVVWAPLPEFISDTPKNVFAWAKYKF